MNIKKEVLVSGAAGTAIGVILMLLFAPWWCGMMAGNQNKIMGSVDAHFIEQMIPHHADAILMANLALVKATHSEIGQLAQNIGKTQSEEIKQMKTWYKNWYGKEVPDVFSNTHHSMGSGMMHMGMMGDASDVERLNKAADFDKVFIEQMIPHHQMAVMMAEMLQQTTNHPEMKQLAKNIIEAQTREINAMRDWYAQWYKAL